MLSDVETVYMLGVMMAALLGLFIGFGICSLIRDSVEAQKRWDGYPTSSVTYDASSHDEGSQKQEPSSLWVIGLEETLESL